MPARKPIALLRQRCRAFAANRQGTSAIEFALLLPLMLTMYFGSIEVTDVATLRTIHVHEVRPNRQHF